MSTCVLTEGCAKLLPTQDPGDHLQPLNYRGKKEIWSQTSRLPFSGITILQQQSQNQNPAFQAPSSSCSTFSLRTPGHLTLVFLRDHSHLGSRNWENPWDKWFLFVSHFFYILFKLPLIAQETPILNGHRYHTHSSTKNSALRALHGGFRPFRPTKRNASWLKPFT